MAVCLGCRDIRYVVTPIETMTRIMVRNRMKSVDRIVMVKTGLSAAAKSSSPDQLARIWHVPLVLMFQEKLNFPSESVASVFNTIHGELLVLT